MRHLHAMRYYWKVFTIVIMLIRATATDPNKIITAASFSIFLITQYIKSHIVLWVTQCIQQNDEHLIKIIIIL